MRGYHWEGVVTIASYKLVSKEFGFVGNSCESVSFGEGVVTIASSKLVWADGVGSILKKWGGN